MEPEELRDLAEVIRTRDVVMALRDAAEEIERLRRIIATDMQVAYAVAQEREACAIVAAEKAVPKFIMNTWSWEQCWKVSGAASADAIRARETI